MARWTTNDADVTVNDPRHTVNGLVEVSKPSEWAKRRMLQKGPVWKIVNRPGR